MFVQGCVCYVHNRSTIVGLGGSVMGSWHRFIVLKHSFQTFVSVNMKPRFEVEAHD